MAVHVRPTAGLLLIFTLLTLINLSNSLLDEEHLDILQEYFQGGLIEAAKKKAQLMDQLTLVEKYHNDQFEKLYPILRQLIAATDSSPSLRELKTVIINFLVKQKTDFAKGKTALENEIEKLWAFIELQEDGHDEL
ncbi:hypothetical protein AMECASPLE_021416 [Ameca splendens]|uniref:Uncharacterized protein n=1 Tax=Ameca splendens TaxID=208324 RepID=A0ABV0XGM8_9TELE